MRVDYINAGAEGAGEGVANAQSVIYQIKFAGIGVWMCAGKFRYYGIRATLESVKLQENAHFSHV